MKWILIFTAVASSEGLTPKSLEFSTKEECEQIGPALLDLVHKVSKFRGTAVCQNPETGESFEVKLPK